MTDRSVFFYSVKKESPKNLHEQRRESSELIILISAEELFARKGYHGVSMNEIAKHSEVSKGLLYHYYESKESLLKAIFQSAFDKMASNFEALEQFDGKDLIRYLIDQAFDFLMYQRDLQRLMIGLAVQVHDLPFVKEIATKKMASHKLLLTSTFEELGYDDPEGEALAFGALLDGIGLQLMVLDIDYDLPKIKEHLYLKYAL